VDGQWCARTTPDRASAANTRATHVRVRERSNTRITRTKRHYLCVMDNRDLTKCECFIDLAKAETKERVGRML